MPRAKTNGSKRSGVKERGFRDSSRGTKNFSRGDEQKWFCELPWLAAGFRKRSDRFSEKLSHPPAPRIFPVLALTSMILVGFLCVPAGTRDIFVRDFLREPGTSRSVPRSIYISQMVGDTGDGRQRGNQMVPSHVHETEGKERESSTYVCRYRHRPFGREKARAFCFYDKNSSKCNQVNVSNRKKEWKTPPGTTRSGAKLWWGLEVQIDTKQSVTKSIVMDLSEKESKTECK